MGWLHVAGTGWSTLTDRRLGRAAIAPGRYGFILKFMLVGCLVC